MEQLNLNNILNRTNQENKLIEYLNYFEENKKNLTVKRGIYIYGSPGSGKTMFVEKILKKLNYDILKYDAGDCLLYTSPSPRDAHESRMPSSA